MEHFTSIVWVVFILMVLLPMVKQYRLKAMRMRAFQALERKRGSRVIALIHREEIISLLGFPIRKFINIEDSEQIMRAIRLTPEDMPIDLILHTPGGLVLAADQIAHAIKSHPAKVTVFIPHYAMSGGTMIGLAADELVMDPNAVLGPVDPQIGRYPAVSLLRVIEDKNINKIEDETLILADIARKAIFQVKGKMFRLLKDRLGDEKAKELADLLTEGHWTHDYPIGCQELEKLGLDVCSRMPSEIYEIMDLFPQPTRRMPSVSYIPIPYERKKNEMGP